MEKPNDDPLGMKEPEGKLIEVKGTVEKKEATFFFKRMSVEEAGEWASKMKSRITFWEATTQQLEILEHVPVEDRDMDKFLKLSDAQARMLGEVTKMAKYVARYVVRPEEAAVQKFIDTDFEGVLAIFHNYIATLFPSEDDQKN